MLAWHVAGCVLEAYVANETKLKVSLAGNAVHLLSSDGSVLSRLEDDLAPEVGEAAGDLAGVVSG